jgi:hypothetical protein
MTRSSPPSVDKAKRVYSDLVRAVLELAAEGPGSRHVVALATVVDMFHDDILRPLEDAGCRGRRDPPGKTWRARKHD